MNKKALQIPNAPAPIGPYSQAILANGMLFISGQCPINPRTGLLEMETIESATHLVMSNIEKLLHAAEMDFTHIVKCSIFLKDLGDFQKVNAVYATYFDSVPPARETVEVARLPLDASIEISCIAMKS
ncbi:MAG: RidA family protein [Flavobacteriia bacterium]|jgi:2-iminobutanoate/2-iminopropanoate deaminase|nr:RidA family protein [Flavobacteriia bacterium]